MPNPGSHIKFTEFTDIGEITPISIQNNSVNLVRIEMYQNKFHDFIRIQYLLYWEGKNTFSNNLNQIPL